MRILIIVGCIVILGPLSQHKVLGNLYGGDRDLYLEENDYGSGEGPDTETDTDTETDLTYLDHEGSGHGKVSHGPYGAVYDTYDDNEDGLDDDLDHEDMDSVDETRYDEEDSIIEGSGVGGTLFIDEEEEDYDPAGDRVYEPVFEVHETVSVEEAPKVESQPNTTPPPTLKDHSEMDNTIQIHTTKTDDRQVSIFAQPGILAAFIGGAVVGLLCAILLVMFIVYRMRKKDEGSYPLDEPKRMPLTSSYSPNDKEIYA